MKIGHRLKMKFGIPIVISPRPNSKGQAPVTKVEISTRTGNTEVHFAGKGNASLYMLDPNTMKALLEFYDETDGRFMEFYNIHMKGKSYARQAPVDRTATNE